jgi:hypothetical protein
MGIERDLLSKNGRFMKFHTGFSWDFHRQHYQLQNNGDVPERSVLSSWRQQC